MNDGIPQELFEIFLNRVGGNEPSNSYTGSAQELMEEVTKWHKSEMKALAEDIKGVLKVQGKPIPLVTIVDEIVDRYLSKNNKEQ